MKEPEQRAGRDKIATSPQGDLLRISVAVPALDNM